MKLVSIEIYSNEMAQVALESGHGPKSTDVFSSGDLGIDDLKVGVTFINEDVGISAILGWGLKTFCPLVKV